MVFFDDEGNLIRGIQGTKSNIEGSVPINRIQSSYFKLVLQFVQFQLIFNLHENNQSKKYDERESVIHPSCFPGNSIKMLMN